MSKKTSKHTPQPWVDLLDAAKDLLADLQDVGDDCNKETGEEYSTVKALRKAIEKAEGR